MPLKTAVPRVRRISAPAPSAMTKGTTPRMKAKEVIMIGRNRSRQASKVASRRSMPDSRFCLANSTMRIAFLLANPTRTMKPICVKMLTSMRIAATPAIEQSRHIGTTRITARGSDQLSYWAARTRNTKTTASPKTYIAVLPARFCMRVNSVHSMAIEGSSCRPTTCSMRWIAWPELVPGAMLPLIVAAGYML